MWVWVNTYRYIFSEMNIHKSQLFWGSLGTRVLTHPHVFVTWGCLGFTALQKRHAEIGNTCLETPGRRAQQWQCTLEIHKKGPYIH